MALLTDAQRQVLSQIDEAKCAIENELQRLNDLLREVVRRDTDATGMNPAGETASALMDRAKAAYAARCAAIVAAAEALPVV